MPAPSDETLAFGEDAITALLGLDALYRAESADGDGLAVLNLDLDGRYAPERFASYAEARERFRELDDRAALLPEPDRRRYYAQLCGSSIAFTQWREEGLPFREQLASFLHVPVAPVADAELDGLRADMRALLDAMGYNGDLREQCRRWEERNRVPADEVEGVLAELMDTAWTHTEERLVEIPAPRSDAMRAVAVTGVPFNEATTSLMNQAGTTLPLLSLRWPVSISCAISTRTSTMSSLALARMRIGSPMMQLLYS